MRACYVATLQKANMHRNGINYGLRKKIEAKLFQKILSQISQSPMQILYMYVCAYTDTHTHTHTHITRLFFLSLRVAGNGYETLHLIKELGIQDKILPADITSNVRASHVDTYARTALYIYLTK
jgi:hypothetical protein